MPAIFANVGIKSVKSMMFPFIVSPGTDGPVTISGTCKPNSVVVCAVRIDDTNLDAIANVRDAALLLSHHGSDYGQQSRDREEHSFHISSPSTLTQEPPRKRLKILRPQKGHKRHIKRAWVFRNSFYAFWAFLWQNFGLPPPVRWSRNYFLPGVPAISQHSTN